MLLYCSHLDIAHDSFVPSEEDVILGENVIIKEFGKLITICFGIELLQYCAERCTIHFSWIVCMKGDSSAATANS